MSCRSWQVTALLQQGSATERSLLGVMPIMVVFPIMIVFGIIVKHGKSESAVVNGYINIGNGGEKHTLFSQASVFAEIVLGMSPQCILRSKVYEKEGSGIYLAIKHVFKTFRVQKVEFRHQY